MGLLKKWFCDHEWNYNGSHKRCEKCRKFVVTNYHETCDHEWNVTDEETLYAGIAQDDGGTFSVEIDIELRECKKCNFSNNQEVEKRKTYFAVERTEVIE